MDDNLTETFAPRVLVINSARKWIGEAAHCFSLIKGLRQRGLFAILVCRRGFVLQEEAGKQGIPCHTLRMKGNFTGIDDLFDLLSLRRIIKENRIDIIHCHRGKDHWLSSCVRLLLKPKPALVRTRHVIVPVKNHMFNRWLYKHGTDGVIAVSERAANSLERVPLKDVPAIIYAAVDSERFSPEKRSEEIRRQYGVTESDPSAPLIGLVGRLQRIKGQGILIHAARKILDTFPNARFIIAGRGSEERTQTLVRLAVKEGVADYFHFAGYMDDIEKLIASLDVGVVASLGSEGSSRIVMEYMASGVPVAATGVGGIPEILEEGLLGRLIEPGNPDELAGAVIEALEEKDETEDKIERALKKSREYLNLTRFIEETLEEYRNTLRAKQPQLLPPH